MVKLYERNGTLSIKAAMYTEYKAEGKMMGLLSKNEQSWERRSGRRFVQASFFDRGRVFLL